MFAMSRMQLCLQCHGCKSAMSRLQLGPLRKPRFAHVGLSCDARHKSREPATPLHVKWTLPQLIKDVFSNQVWHRSDLISLRLRPELIRPRRVLR